MNDKNVSDYQMDLIDDAYHNIQYAANVNLITSNAIKSWLYAQLTGIWTSCEILFADLWEAAVNAKPSELHGFDNEAKLGSAIRMARLKEYNFNISNNLGTLLREVKNFDSFDNVIKEYKNSFSVDGTGVLTAIEHNCFKILNNTRHIIVHNAAKYDAKYLGKVEKITTAPRGALGEEIQIDAQVVYDILHPVANQITCLIGEVDAWILAH